MRQLVQAKKTSYKGLILPAQYYANSIEEMKEIEGWIREPHIWHLSNLKVLDLGRTWHESGMYFRFGGKDSNPASYQDGVIDDKSEVSANFLERIVSDSQLFEASKEIKKGQIIKHLTAHFGSKNSQPANIFDRDQNLISIQAQTGWLEVITMEFDYIAKGGKKNMVQGYIGRIANILNPNPSPIPQP